MGRRKKIIVVGLPLFSKKFASEFSKFTDEYRLIALDTYYSKLDKLKFLFHILTADLIFSINGSLTKSLVFDIAFIRKIPVIMNWVGTDVVKSIQAFKNNTYVSKYKDEAIHFCEVDWIRDELKEIGIEAEISNFASFDKFFELKPTNNQRLTVLSYIPDNRAEFYGINDILELSKSFPNIDFLIVGGHSEGYKPLPENYKAIGWVKDMGPIYDKIDICIRHTEHDGLSTFVLEGLARGKVVFYNNKFSHCHFTPNLDALKLQISQVLSSFDSGSNTLNNEGAAFISTEFSKDVIFKKLKTKIENVIG